MRQPNCDRCGEPVAAEDGVNSYEINSVDTMGHLESVVGHEVVLHPRCVPSGARLYAIPVEGAPCGFTDEKWVCVREAHAGDPDHLFFEHSLTPAGPRAGALRIA
jgi:hypothetical protein